MPRANSKGIRTSLARPQQESKDWMKSQAEVCQKVASRWCVATRDVARAYSLWSFSCTAQFDTASLAYA